MHKYFRKLKVGHLLSFTLLIAFIFPPDTLFAASADAGEKLVNKKCSSCHRFEMESKKLKFLQLKKMGLNYSKLALWFCGNKELLQFNYRSPSIGLRNS